MVKFGFFFFFYTLKTIINSIPTHMNIINTRHKTPNTKSLPLKPVVDRHFYSILLLLMLTTNCLIMSPVSLISYSTPTSSRNLSHNKLLYRFIVTSTLRDFSQKQLKYSPSNGTKIFKCKPKERKRKPLKLLNERFHVRFINRPNHDRGRRSTVQVPKDPNFHSQHR